MFFALTVMLLGSLTSRAQVADSVDVKDYDVTLDLSNGSPFGAYADLTMRLLRPCATVRLDFVGDVDSLKINNNWVANPDMEALPTAGIAAGVDFHVQVWYRGHRNIENYGWGGFHFDNDMHYNLGVGFESNPHVTGRSVFPCRDNFHDKATYTFRVKAKQGWTAECGGMLQSRDTNADGNELSVWRIAQPTPTYLASVSQAPWTRVQDTIVSLYGSYPLTVGYINRMEQMVRSAFAELDSVVPMFERCFGPYRWGRIGYIATHKGSMEHVNNIALAEDFIASTSERAQSTIAHELGHAWFGNLITCATEGNMWINEGGASFTSEVAMEAVRGREASDDYYQRNLESVLRTTHVTDGGYRALYGIPYNYVYGSTVYDKGWMVWHSLRSYLGEELFYNAMNTLMERCAFSNLDSYQLRDSLSLYTGVDLTDFFDFHVFSPGFVDYRVEMDGNGCLGNQVGVRIRQQTVGTNHALRSSHVPVTFYAQPGYDSTMCKRVIAFEGNEWYDVVDLPFEPAYCVLDRDLELSDAATVVATNLEARVRKPMAVAHMMASAYNPLNIAVEHHMAPSMGEMPGGVIRKAKRYWMVRGQWTPNDSVKGWFRFVRTGNANSSYANLDRGFYGKSVTADSLGLFYRRNNEAPWQLVSRLREGETNEGWMVCENMMPGEYTLAVVDFEHLSIDRPRTVEAQLFPNPLKKGQPLTVEVDTEEPFTVTIFDEGGRQVWQKKGCHNGQKLSTGLAKGTYFVRIENNFISLHSKLIQL